MHRLAADVENAYAGLEKKGKGKKGKGAAAKAESSQPEDKKLMHSLDMLGAFATLKVRLPDSALLWDSCYIVLFFSVHLLKLSEDVNAHVSWSAASLNPLFCKRHSAFLHEMHYAANDSDMLRSQITCVLNIISVTCIMNQLDCSDGIEELAFCISEGKLEFNTTAHMHKSVLCANAGGGALDDQQGGGDSDGHTRP